MRIRRTDNIICYDNPGFLTVGRAHWMLRYFGAEHVRILNGGLKKWVSEGRPFCQGGHEPGKGLEAEGDYNYSEVNPDMVVMDINKIHETAHKIVHRKTDVQIIDVRPPEVVREGGITGATNLYFMQLVNSDGTLKSDEQIAKVSKPHSNGFGRSFKIMESI